LTQFGVAGVLSDPALDLYDASNNLIATNDDWQSAANAAQVTGSGFAPPNSKEPAILMSLTPGNYTAIVRGAGNGTGLALIEGYDLDPTAGSKFGDISTRGFVQTGNGVMIAGVIVKGPNAEDVVIRGIGPTLAGFGVPDVLADPFLDLRDVNGNQLATNDNWKSSQQSALQASGYAPPNDNEAAILLTLNPGNYTAILTGVNGGTGNALVEVYGTN
jgi:hypothetical protein